MDTFVQQLINGLTIGAIYALIAVGYTMVYGVLRLINFAHGDIYMVGAVVGLYAANAWFYWAAQPRDPALIRPWDIVLLVAVFLIVAAIIWGSQANRRTLAARRLPAGADAAQALARLARRATRPGDTGRGQFRHDRHGHADRLVRHGRRGAGGGRRGDRHHDPRLHDRADGRPAVHRHEHPHGP